MDAIYARQSLDKADSLSIEGQIEICRKYAGSDVRIFQDKGFSGKNINRPAFKELISGVEDGSIKKIFVYRLDRFSRSIADFSRLWELLEAHGVSFNSVTENFDTSSPIGRAMLNIVLVFAQLERETTAERVRDNYIHRFSLGAWPGGPAPYGFDIGKTVDSEGRRVSTLNANDSSVVVGRIFDEYSQPQTSLRGIAVKLTADGIHGPKREAWDNVTLSRILRSPLYVMADEDVYLYYLSRGMQIQQPAEAFDGIHACNVIGRRAQDKGKYTASDRQLVTVANHVGFISAPLWLRVQSKLEANRQISQARAGKYSWLTGLIKCGKCGYAVKINHSKSDDRLHLICSGRANLASCDATIDIELHELEQCVAGQLKEVLAACPPEALGSDTGAAQEILEIEEKIGRLVNALAQAGSASSVYITRQIDLLDEKRHRLTQEQLQTQTKAQQIDFDKASFDEKKLIAAQFINRILLEGSTATIKWNF